MGMSFLNFFSSDVGIDLGTANTLIYVKGKGIVVNEPSIIALEDNSDKIIAVGNEARQMLGRTHQQITTIRPLKDGVIADFEATEIMIRELIRKANINRMMIGKIVVCVPSGVTEVEKRAVRDSAERAGAREVNLVAEAMAAAIGVGLEIDAPVGNMIVDIGGGTSEIAVISLYGIVNHTSIRVGGDEMNLAIIQHFKKKFNLLIGEKTAEDIKCNIGSAYPLEEEQKVEVKGRDLVDGIPKTIEIDSSEIRAALNDSIASIVDAIKLSLERTPPELASDILDRGIILSGGGALLKNLDIRLREDTSMAIHVADDPLTCVARGCGKILDNPERYEKVLLHHRRSI
ncbi:MAG TPA: rod shape-determining protein [Caldithrix abyssi]|uniref:Cell shape-determining protein MreB n=1 Tax=Caldithrix abyssi TaxID=187145 RepID=A0A7V4U406_CALAY|nr:rod shape-determining protein [Caldithrix abyssi]